jgi:hypothetical protein
MPLDPVFLSRLQFAFVVSFHIVFPAFTIGLAAWLATIEGCTSRLGIQSTGGSSTFGSGSLRCRSPWAWSVAS